MQIGQIAPLSLVLRDVIRAQIVESKLRGHDASRAGGNHRASPCGLEAGFGVRGAIPIREHRAYSIIFRDKPQAGKQVGEYQAHRYCLDQHLATLLGAHQAHYRYLFANARTPRIKLRVHDGFGMCCAARRLDAGRLTQAQFDALVRGLT